MAKAPARVKEAARHYDTRGILSEIDEGDIEFALEEDLRAQILDGKRTRRLENISIKLDPAHIRAVRKIATMNAVPYQTLIRQWIAAAIRRELRLDVRTARRR